MNSPKSPARPDACDKDVQALLVRLRCPTPLHLAPAHQAFGESGLGDAVGYADAQRSTEACIRFSDGPMRTLNADEDLACLLE